MADMDEIDLLLYLPGSFVCRKCHFLLEKRTISASSGQIGIRKGGEPIEPCPNCAIPLERMTWREAYEAIAEQAGGEMNIALVHALKEFERGCSNDGHLAARKSNWTTFEKPLPENCPECVRAFVSHLKTLVQTAAYHFGNLPRIPGSH